MLFGASPFSTLSLAVNENLQGVDIGGISLCGRLKMQIAGDENKVKFMNESYRLANAVSIKGMDRGC